MEDLSKDEAEEFKQALNHIFAHADSFPRNREIARFSQALSKETDRGCALIACALLEDMLKEILIAKLVEHKDAEKDLFKGDAPLATFSSRIRMAYYLGLISPDELSEINVLRGIRNAFAHTHHEISFDSPEVRSRCASLRFSWWESSKPPRWHFEASVYHFTGTLQVKKIHLVKHIEAFKLLPPTSEENAERRKAIEVLRVAGEAYYQNLLKE